MLSYLGQDWCQAPPRFPDALAAGYSQHVIERGGVITWEVPIMPTGTIPESFVEQLQKISQRL